jgi:hypothetical protein
VKKVPRRIFSRLYVSFISDLKFGSEHEIQRSKRADLINVAAAPHLAGSSHRGAEGLDGSRRKA